MGWVVSASTCLAFYFSFGVILSFSILLVSLQEEFNSSVTTVGGSWIGSAPFGIASFVSIPVNLLIERFGCRCVVTCGVAALAIGLFLTSLMPNIAPIFFTYSLLYGVGTGCIMFGSFSLLHEYFPLRHLTAAVTLPMASSNLAMLTLGPFIFFLNNRLGWRNTIRIIAGIITAIVLPTCAWTHREPLARTEESTSSEGDGSEKVRLQTDPAPRATVARDAEGDSIESPMLCVSKTSEELKVAVSRDNDVEDGMSSCASRGACQSLNETSGFNSHIFQRSLGIGILVATTYPDAWFLAIGSFGFGLVNSFFSIQMVKYMLSLGFTEANGAQAVVAIGIALMVGKVVIVIVSDSLPFHKLYLSTIASTTGITVMACLLVSESLAGVMTLLVVEGAVVMSVGDSLPFSIANHVFGASKGRPISTLLAMSNGLGMILASVLGESVDRTGSYGIALYVCIGVYALTGVLFLLVPIYHRYQVTDRHTMVSWTGCGNGNKRKKLDAVDCKDDMSGGVKGISSISSISL
ncbi:monocarboxylate transporter 7-like [Diadema setosum]|uniref:monocarboxylate transporter 7-like n=1 Tax=Diadema setosum TaxID=31175 RepID=UPI003B3A97EF